MEKVQAAPRDGRDREALRSAIQVRASVESAGLPESQGWTKVSGQFLHRKAWLMPLCESWSRGARGRVP
ncbi:hypothetical protein ABT247_13420 [Kitasatospora sp. NPDC001539]|uniref:hypothetical protein n=1 Tax=Kitasatospora sp. NPDC001539 TaxID=3154384 RepID=UPI00332789BC